MSLIDAKFIIKALEELESIDKQNKRWLNDGDDHSSLSEATETLFADSGLEIAMQKIQANYPLELIELFAKLDATIREINPDRSAASIIKDPIMKTVREIAAEILRDYFPKKPKT